jgi:hypothetical protein
MSQTHAYRITPSTMATLGVAIDLLGADSIIDAGSWLTPFIVRATPDDALALCQCLDELTDTTHIADPVHATSQEGAW